MDTDEVYGVCVGTVRTGQIVDWSPGSAQPDPVAWFHEAEFVALLKAATEAGTAVLPTIDFYSQNRLGRDDCARMMRSWNDLASAVEGTIAEAPAAAIRRMAQLCSQGSGDLELLIEGP
jgi:hypothetical protein